MKIYVAGSSQERPRYRHFLEALHAVGFDVVYNWADHIDGCSSPPTDEELSAAERECLLAVATCDVFVLLIPQTPSKGSWVELGYARALKKHTIGVGDASALDCWTVDNVHARYSSALYELVDAQHCRAQDRVNDAVAFLVACETYETVAGCSEPTPTRSPTPNADTPSSAPSAAPIEATTGSPDAAAPASSSPLDAAETLPQAEPRSASPCHFRDDNACKLALSSLEPIEVCDVCGHLAAAHRLYPRRVKSAQAWLSALDRYFVGVPDIDLTDLTMLVSGRVSIGTSHTKTSEAAYNAIRDLVPASISITVAVFNDISATVLETDE